MSKRKNRTASVSKRPNRAATKRSRAGQVWHVFRFRERFELADDQRFCRKGPLIYARDYVTPADDESCAYLQQIECLRRHNEGLELEGAWARIRAAASRRSRAYRGYLLNERLERASTSEIARTVLYVTPQRAEKILAVLEAVGLIERVPVPDWDLSVNDLPKKKLGRARETTSATERRRAPLHAKRKLKAKPRPSASEKQGKEKPRPSASAEGQSQKATTTTEETTTAPTAAPPTWPTPSDHQGSRIAAHGPPPGGSVHHDGPVHIGGVLGQTRRRCNAAALQAGRDIYRALGSPWTDDSPESAREVGAFASCFERAMASGLGPTVLVGLWEDLTKEAERLRKVYAKNGGYRSAARVWCKKIFPGKLAAAAPQRSPPGRAGI